MKKSVKAIIVLALLLIGVISFQLLAGADSKMIDNQFVSEFEGYTSDETEVLTSDYISSKEISVKAGDSVWFGPCDTTQYFHLVGLDANGNTVTDKIRGKELEVTDTFSNNLVIYKYEVPSGVEKLVFSAPASVAKVYTVSKQEFNLLSWDAHWTSEGVNTEEYIGQSSFYKVAQGDTIYFGAVTKEQAEATIIYDNLANKIGTVDKKDLKLVESFGGAYGIYSYSVSGANTQYVQVPYDTNYEQYYTNIHLKKNETMSKEKVVEHFVSEFGVQRPVASTVKALKGKSALFVGDSITFGARDRANIYGCTCLNENAGGWAARIGYYCDMNVTNNGVSGACISTARVESHSEKHYIYNNLVAAKNNNYDYVIMHGLFNDASIPVELGTAKGPKNFDAGKADTSKFADSLELLFYTAKKQHPEAILGYIVNFETERNVDQAPYVALAIEICEAWGIEYLDLFHNATLDIEFDDGLHPSSKGYDDLYRVVANWMAELDGNMSKDTVESTATIMSYNVYWDTTNPTPVEISGSVAGSIANRVEGVSGIIKSANADILLLQEVSSGNAGWAKVIAQNASDLGYAYYGFTHLGGKDLDTAASAESGEITPILWKTAKYDLVKSGHFWASSTPEVAGSIWKGVETATEKNYPRCINWVILKDKTTKETLFVMNYHADPYTEEIRDLSAELILEKISEITADYKDITVVLGGDMNMQRNHTAYSIFSGNGYHDAQKNAVNTATQGSYNAWNRETTKFGFGDYLFVDGESSITTYKVINDYDETSGFYLSDHSPIWATIKY